MKEELKKTLITIVVPVYRVEQYLDRCVESLIKQTYSDIEIILVDDGSPDRCGDICELWAQYDSRIKVIHKLNGGLSDARNVGIMKAEGDYITFVDSDDYVSNNYIEYLYTMIKTMGADSACCMFKRVTHSSDTFEVCANEKLELITGREACSWLYTEHYVQMVVACGKLYRTNIVRKSLYPVGRLHEDEATTYKYFYNSRRVAVSNVALYAYFQNEQSITHKRSIKNETDTNTAYQERVAYFKERQEWALYAKTLNFYVGILSVRNDEANLHEMKRLFDLYWADVHVFLRTKLRMARYILMFKK